MRFNYSLADAPVLKPVDDGIYLLKVIVSKEKKNDKNNDVITYEMEIMEPQNVRVDGAVVEKLYIPYYISADDPMKSLCFLRPLFEACGKLIPDAKDFDTEDIYGCVFGAEIIKRPPTTEFPDPQNRIRNYFSQENCPPPGVKPKDED